MLNKSMSKPNVQEFFSTFTKNSDFFLQLPIFWTVSIDTITKDKINQALDEYGVNKWRCIRDAMFYTKKSGNILVAQEINLPSEKATFTTTDMGNNYGGYMPTYVVNSRENFHNKLSINFLETQRDIDQNFFRPWMIAIATKGLFGGDLTSTMTVKQYTNNGDFMKGFKFQNVFPVAVEGYKLDYTDTEIKQRSITFSYTQYEQIIFDL